MDIPHLGHLSLTPPAWVEDPSDKKNPCQSMGDHNQVRDSAPEGSADSDAAAQSDTRHRQPRQDQGHRLRLRHRRSRLLQEHT